MTTPLPSPWWRADAHQDRRPFLTARNAIKRALRGWFEADGFTEVEAAALQVSPGNEAHLHAFAGLRELEWGCEHFGPQILTDDLVTEPLRFEEFHVHLPPGPGLGVTLDRDKLRRYARA